MFRDDCNGCYRPGSVVGELALMNDQSRPLRKGQDAKHDVRRCCTVLYGAVKRRSGAYPTSEAIADPHFQNLLPSQNLPAGLNSRLEEASNRSGNTLARPYQRPFSP